MRFSKSLKLGLISVTVAAMLCACGGNVSMEEVINNSETIDRMTTTEEQTTENMIADGEDVTDVESDDSTEKSGSGILDDLTSKQTTSSESDHNKKAAVYYRTKNNCEADYNTANYAEADYAETNYHTETNNDATTNYYTETNYHTETNNDATTNYYPTANYCATKSSLHSYSKESGWYGV